MNRKYNIVIFSNAAEWCYYCWRNYLSQHKEVTFYKYSFPIPFINRKVYILLKYLFHPDKQNRDKFYLSRFFLRLLMQFFVRISRKDNNIIIMYDWNVLATDEKFLNNIRKKYPHTLIAYVFTNVTRISGANKWGLLSHLKNYYDAVYAFDKIDADNYGFSYLPLIYSRENTQEKIDNVEEIDVFYVGKAKDRLDIIHEIFEKCKSEGLKCDFNIINVPEDKQLYKDEIHYNKLIPYKDVISKIKKSKCLLDVIQGESTGLTIKVAESVVYNKKLITNNPNVLKEMKMEDFNVLLYDKQCDFKSFILSGRPCHKEEDINYF